MSETLNKVDYKLSFLQENIEVVSYSMICFLVPFLLGHPQWLVGTIVNTALILASLNLKFNKTLPVILIPSVGVLSAGLLFSSLTPFLLYMVPFIWISNTILVLGIKYYNLYKKKNYYLIMVLSSIAKSLFLSLIILTFIWLNIIPMALFIPFSVLQLGTALSGGLIARGIHLFKKKLNSHG